MTDIKELALKVAKEMPEQSLPDGEDLGDYFVLFVTRFLAAYTEGQEPVASRCNGGGETYYFGISRPDPSAWDTCIPLYTTPPLPAIPESALSKFNRFGFADDDQSPIEKLRAFCSLAMNGRDWIDVEPFIDALPAIPEGMALVPREPTEAMIDAAENSAWRGDNLQLGDMCKAMIAAGEVKL